MFQQPIFLRADVAENVAFALKPLGLSRAEARARIEACLARVGLVHRARDSARKLSGGERQRLALARVWAVAPRLLLLDDEPTAALDPTATDMIEQLIRQIRSDGARIVFTTHNLRPGAAPVRRRAVSRRRRRARTFVDPALFRSPAIGRSPPVHPRRIAMAHRFRSLILGLAALCLAQAAHAEDIVVASTTSTEQSGLFARY